MGRMYFLYSVLLAVAVVVWSPVLLYRLLTQGKYRAGFAERLGRVPYRLRSPSAKRTIWLHAVSVGEVLAVSRLIEQMHDRWPEHRIVISTTTATGQKLARQRFGEHNVFYFPLDLSFAIRPYLRTLRPEMVVLAETEFWPNFLRLVKRSGARIAVVNARISDRSLPRYRRMRKWLRRVLNNIEIVLAQTDEDRRRLLEIGADPARVHTAGNLKFDVRTASTSQIADELRQEFQRGGAGPVIVCGSTVEGEEPQLIDAFHTILRDFPRAVMVVAPRHPERFSKVTALLLSSRLPVWRRSSWDKLEPVRGGIFLLDSIGELPAVYAVADLAFVGGSLMPRGGHNILEPAQHGVAITVGPHTQNFREMVELFGAARALRVLRPHEIGQQVASLLADGAERRRMGQAAASLFQANSGATTRTLDGLARLLSADARWQAGEAR